MQSALPDPKGPVNAAGPALPGGQGLSFAEKGRRWAWYGLLALLFAGFYLFNHLAPLMSDDYNYAFSFADGRRIAGVGDIFSSMAAHYHNSNGRLITHFFAQLMLWVGKPVFNVINSLMAVFLLLGLCRLTTENKRDVGLLALWSAALCVVLPTLGQVMFWLTSACNYLWGSTLIVWMMVPFRRMLLSREHPLGWWQAAALLPGCFAMGTVSENGAPAAILFMVLCCGYQLLRRRPVKPWMWGAIALSVAGFLWMVLSPASQARNAIYLPSGASFFGKYLITFTKCVTIFLEHGLIPACVFLVLFGYALCAKAERERLALSLMLFVCGVASHFAMTAAGEYPLRAMTASFLMMLAASGVLLPVLRDTPLRPLLLGATLALCLAAGMLCLQAAPQTYDRYREAQAREQQMLQAQAEGKREVSTYNISGKTKFDVFYDMIDLTYEADYFSNAVFARYYGLDSVVIDELR